MRCTEVADRPFFDGKFFGRDIGDRGRYPAQTNPFMPRLERFSRSIKQRMVTHVICGAQFDIARPTIAEICNPLSVHTDIHCLSCGKDSSVDTYEWSDTGENLLLFRERLRSSMPMVLRYIDSNTTHYSCLLAIAISGSIAVYYDNVWLMSPALATLTYQVMAHLIALIWSVAANFEDVI